MVEGFDFFKVGVSVVGFRFWRVWNVFSTFFYLIIKERVFGLGYIFEVVVMIGG